MCFCRRHVCRTIFLLFYSLIIYSFVIFVITSNSSTSSVVLFPHATCLLLNNTTWFDVFRLSSWVTSRGHFCSVCSFSQVSLFPLHSRIPFRLKYKVIISCLSSYIHRRWRLNDTLWLSVIFSRVLGLLDHVHHLVLLLIRFMFLSEQSSFEAHINTFLSRFSSSDMISLVFDGLFSNNFPLTWVVFQVSIVYFNCPLQFSSFLTCKLLLHHGSSHNNTNDVTHRGPKDLEIIQNTERKKKQRKRRTDKPQMKFVLTKTRLLSDVLS